MLRPKVNLVVLDPGSGKARPGAWVTFYRANTLDLSALYADDDLTGIPNPVQANGLGQVAVRLATGTYDISMAWDGAQPTVVEDVLAWSPGADVITSPGDLIIGDGAGSPTRLAVGANGQVLLVDNGLPAWKTLGAGVGLPAGSAGALLSYGPTGALTSVLPGMQDQALVMAGGLPTWGSILAAGQVLPINQPGDLVVGAVSTGLPVRMARGNTDDVLKVQSTGALGWAPTNTVGPGGGSCYLDATGGNLVLYPDQGNQLYINGQVYTIPDGGTAPLAPGGYTPGVTYYIYAYASGSQILLTGSMTPYEWTGGYAHAQADGRFALVGLARLIAGNVWGFTPTQHFLLSYFHPQSATATNHFSATRVISSPTNPYYVEINPEIRIEFLSWAWLQCIASVSGVAWMDNAGIRVETLITVDGAAVSSSAVTAGIAGTFFNFSQTKIGSYAEGYHVASLTASAQAVGGLVAYAGDPNALNATRLNLILLGTH